MEIFLSFIISLYITHDNSNIAECVSMNVKKIITLNVCNCNWNNCLIDPTKCEHLFPQFSHYSS